MIKELSSVDESSVAFLSILYFLLCVNNGVHSLVLSRHCSTQVVTGCSIVVCCFK